MATTNLNLIPGVGYQALGSTVYWVRPGGGLVSTTPFNPRTPDPFSGSQINIQAFRDRYGANTKSGRLELGDGTICMFPVDAESIGILTRAMALAGQTQGFPEFRGTLATHTMEPTTLEVYDYAATHHDGGRSLMTAMGVGGGAAGSGSGSGVGSGATGPLPGRPRIERISSPDPGILYLEWITSEASGFELNVETERDDGPGWNHQIPDPKMGNLRKMRIPVPDYIHGQCVVKIRANRGENRGPWSLSKRVDIKKGEAVKAEGPKETENPLLSSYWMDSLRALSLSYPREQVEGALDRLYK